MILPIAKYDGQILSEFQRSDLRRLSDQKRRSMGAPARRSRFFSGTASPDFLKAVNEINTSDNV